MLIKIQTPKWGVGQTAQPRQMVDTVLESIWTSQADGSTSITRIPSLGKPQKFTLKIIIHAVFVVDNDFSAIYRQVLSCFNFILYPHLKYSMQLCS